jgi:hypothetical protein
MTLMRTGRNSKRLGLEVSDRTLLNCVFSFAAGFPAYA